MEEKLGWFVATVCAIVVSALAAPVVFLAYQIWITGAYQ